MVLSYKISSSQELSEIFLIMNIDDVYIMYKKGMVQFTHAAQYSVGTDQDHGYT